MGTLKGVTLTLPGSYGLNTQDDIAADQALRFGALVSNGVVDQSGKLISRKDFVLQTTGYSTVLDTIYRHVTAAGADVFMSSGGGIINSGIATLTSRFDHRAGSQVVDVGGAKVGASATGLANSTEAYGFTVAVDGGAAQQVTVTGSAAQTWTNLITQIDADLTGATSAITGGNLKITSATTGASSSIAIGVGKGTASNALLTTLTNFVAARVASPGTITNDNWQFATLSGKIYAAQADQYFTCLNEDTFAVESIIGQPWVGSPNIVMAADGRLWAADDTAGTTSGYQVVTVGGDKTASSATNLVAATTYTASVVIDGGASQSISVVGSTGLTFALLIAQLDLDVSGARFEMVDGNLRCISNSGGAGSTVAITAGTLFAAPLNGFSAVETAVAGSATSVANRHTIWWSDLLNGKSWDGGDAGSISLINAWPEGADIVQGLAMNNGRLVVFGMNSILMYTLPADHDPGSMSLTDVATNIGCIARDSVVETPYGVFFLARSGIYRTEPLTQVTSLLRPVPVSTLIEDEVQTAIDAETLKTVRAWYYPRERWYVITFPTSNKSFCVHVAKNVPGIEPPVPVITTWKNSAVPFNGFAYDVNGDFFNAMRNGIGKYTGYTSDGASNGYDLELYTQWLDHGDETKLKHLKKLDFVLEAASGQTGTARWLTDFAAGTVNTVAFTCSSTEFAENPGMGRVSVNIGRSCNVGKYGFTATISGNAVAVHRMKIYANTGAAKAGTTK